MDKQLEERIRQRAYELWIQHGSLPGRDEEYWYQAEQEILGRSDAQTAGNVEGGAASEPEAASGRGEEEQASLDVSPAPLGMVSETSDEVPPAPAPAPAKTRKRRSTAPASPEESGGAAAEAPKRRRSPRSTSGT